MSGFKNVVGADHFRDFALSLAHNGSPLLSGFSAGVASDPDLLRIAGRTRTGQHAGYLLFQSVHFLLARNPREPLAAWYPTLSAAPPPVGEPFAVFREFCLRNAAALEALLADRTVQFTAVERATPIMLALAEVDARVGAAMELIEIGSSAGICLQFDRYRYDFGAGRVLGDPASPVCLQAPFRGRAPEPPAALPRIARRTGVDLAPLDPADEDARAWIEAALFPEWVQARARLRAAWELLRAAPPRIVRGDALAVLPDLVAAAQGPVCVFHSFCLSYWSTEALDAFDRLLRDLSRDRILHLVSLELPADMGEGGRAERYRSGGTVAIPIMHLTYDRGDVKRRELGICNGFGHWIQWG
ncbi:MAG: DUF2332 domain-containing protein [Gammaproteobacteria bacterium]